MATKLDRWPGEVNLNDDWFDGDRWSLTVGVDFDEGTADRVRTAFAEEAKQRGLVPQTKTIVKAEDGDETIGLRATFPVDDDEDDTTPLEDGI